MSEQILIIDDDEDTLILIGMILKRRGFEPITASSGPEALSALARTVPDLIILDVMMPGMDGNQVCQQIKADSRTANVPVVMLTARSETANQIEGLLAGADDYVVKPVSTEELMASVQSALERAAGAPVKRMAQVIAVLGARGGVGATTLAVNLAVALASQVRTVLIDLETDGTAAFHLGFSPTHGLGDLLAYPADVLDMDSVENALTLHPSGLNLLASTNAPVDVTRAGIILSHVRAVYDACLLDLGAGLSQVARALVPRSNVWILALDSDRVTLAQAEQVAHGLCEMGVPLPKVKLVRINRLGTPDEAAQAAIRSAFGKEAASIGPASDAMVQALERGEPLVVSQPDHPVAAQIRALATTLLTPA